MDRETRYYINDLAQQVINAYNITVPITDINAIVRQMGGTIEEQINFDDLCDGTIMKTGDSAFSIMTSPFQSSQRKTFTIAHELGHLFLHMGFRTNPALWERQDQTVYRRFGRSTQEYQANEFAASLLMPQELYKQTLKQYTSDNEVDIKSVARYFNVSVAAAVNRGRFLGCLT